MAKFSIQETYLYTVEAETPEQARELWQSFMESDGDDDASQEFVVTSDGNLLDVFDEDGREV
jgi:hypothetical protein